MNKFFFTMSRVAADQQADCCMANDNMTVAQQRQSARAMAEWAATRGRDAGFERFAFAAAAEAQSMQADADRRVRQSMK